MKIVVIDDSEVALSLTARALRDAGMEVVTLQSPLGAAQTLANERPDLVLMDIDMPALSGEKAAAVLKRQRSLQSIKIVLYSDRHPSQLDAAVQRCGADGFVRKTQDFAVLVADVKRQAGA